MSAVQLGDLVALHDGTPAVVLRLSTIAPAAAEGATAPSVPAAQVELPGGGRVWHPIAELQRLAGDQLTRAVEAPETSELPRVVLPLAVVPEELPELVRGRATQVDELRSLLILLDCLEGINGALNRGRISVAERFERVQAAYDKATDEVLRLVEQRLREPGHGG